MNTLYLMVARGGSKGVPRKNLKVLGHHSLIAWKTAPVKKILSNGDMLVLSTDDKTIADEGLACGIPMVIDRPKELATDEAPTNLVVKHALAVMRGYNQTFTHVNLLEPSAPFTRTTDYIRARDLDYDAVIGMRFTDHEAFVCPRNEDQMLTEMILEMPKNRLRQEFHPRWTPCAALYRFKTEMFVRTEDIYGSPETRGLLIPRWHGIEVDVPSDFTLAEMVADRGLVKYGE